jgi:PncC family amidohydrolase
MKPLFLEMVMRLEGSDLINKVSNLLSEQKLTIATAESCTGGLIAHSLTNISGSSDYFDRGVISYSNQAKNELLDVPQNLLIEHGAVSEQVAKAMAEGVRKKSNVDIGISTTGIAGPSGGIKEKPVGLVYIGISTCDKTEVKKFQFSGSRLENKHSTCNAALLMLYEELCSL